MRHDHAMDTRDLRWFQQVADGITVTELSEIEGTTQPGVSRALARLDREVGTPLLQRGGRTLRMTHAGSVFKRHVDALLHQLDDGLAAVQQLIDPETGTVTLAFHPSLGTWLVPALVSSFRREHPQVQFRLLPQMDRAPAVGPRAAVDLELSTVRPHPGDLKWRRLGEEPLLLAVPMTHRLATSSGPVDLMEAATEEFVLVQPGSALRETTLELAARAGFTPREAFECEDLATTRAFVASGLGISVLPAPPGHHPLMSDSPDSSVSSTDVAEVCYRPLTDPQAVREIGVAWSSEHRMLPAARIFHEHVLGPAGRAVLNA